MHILWTSFEEERLVSVPDGAMQSPIIIFSTVIQSEIKTHTQLTEVFNHEKPTTPSPTAQQRLGIQQIPFPQVPTGQVQHGNEKKIPNFCARNQQTVTVLVLLIVYNVLHDNCMYHVLIYTLSYPDNLNLHKTILLQAAHKNKTQKWY